MVSPRWGLVGRGVEYWGGRDPKYLLVTNVLYFITSVGNHPFPYHFMAIWVYFTGMVVFHEANLTVVQLETQRINLANRRQAVTRDGDVFLIQKGAWRKHMLRIIPDLDFQIRTNVQKNEAQQPIRSFPSLSLAFSDTLIKRPILKHRNMKL